MSSGTSKICPIVLRVAGLILLITGIALTESRSGDWFFRSESFDPRFSSLLLALRLGAGAAGMALIIAGGALGRAIAARWRSLSEAGKLMVVTFLLVVTGSLVFALSVYFRENMVLLETITPYQARYKVLGFNFLIQMDQLRTADFLTAVFLIIAGTISYCMYSLHRLGVCGTPAPDKRVSPNMWLLFALGFYYLALDEFFGIHEFIGDNCPLFHIVKITHHPDDQVIALYFCAGLAIMIRYVRYLTRCKPALAMLVIGIVLHSMAVVADAFVDAFSIEEGLEMVTMIFYSSAIAQYALNEIVSNRKHP